MKSHRIAWVVGLSCWVLLTALPAAEVVLRIRADAWMPFNGEPDAHRPGYVVEIARKVFEPAGIKVDYQTMPWTEALEGARAGTVDAVIGANPTEAEGLVIPKKSAGEPRVGLFVKKESPWKYDNLQSLLSVRLGAIESYSYWDAFDAYVGKGSSEKVVLFKGDEPLVEGIAHLKDGRIDVMAETLSVFIWTVKQTGGSPADYRVAYLQAGEPIYMAFAENEVGRRCANLFDEGVTRLRKNGELEAILRRYGLSDWE